jgi:hypothetical protein
MSRSTNILGFAFLALAATLAISITMHNAPAPTKAGSRPGVLPSGAEVARGATAASERPATAARPAGGRSPVRDLFKVSVPDAWLAEQPAALRQEWLDRATAVEREAGAQLEKLTASLDLNSIQRAKLFPALVRGAAGYDPVMVVGGSTVATDPGLTPAEEIHALLNPDQQEELEDNEVQRQLWWQDIIDKLEVDLTNATGGSSAQPAPVPAEPAPADGERTAPEGRGNANLFDLIEPR